LQLYFFYLAVIFLGCKADTPPAAVSENCKYASWQNTGDMEALLLMAGFCLGLNILSFNLDKDWNSLSMKIKIGHGGTVVVALDMAKIFFMI
jgi:hypothetical protein